MVAFFESRVCILHIFLTPVAVFTILGMSNPGIPWAPLAILWSDLLTVQMGMAQSGKGLVQTHIKATAGIEVGCPSVQNAACPRDSYTE